MPDDVRHHLGPQHRGRGTESGHNRLYQWRPRGPSQPARPEGGYHDIGTEKCVRTVLKNQGPCGHEPVHGGEFVSRRRLLLRRVDCDMRLSEREIPTVV